LLQTPYVLEVAGEVVADALDGDVIGAARAPEVATFLEVAGRVG
jgi:hypothetical protein